MLWHLPYPRLKPGMLCPQPDEFKPHTCLLNPDVNCLPCRVVEYLLEVLMCSVCVVVYPLGKMPAAPQPV